MYTEKIINAISIGYAAICVCKGKITIMLRDSGCTGCNCAPCLWMKQWLFRQISTSSLFINACDQNRYSFIQKWFVHDLYQHFTSNLNLWYMNFVHIVHLLNNPHSLFAFNLKCFNKLFQHFYTINSQCSELSEWNGGGIFNLWTNYRFVGLFQVVFPSDSIESHLRFKLLSFNGTI